MKKITFLTLVMIIGMSSVSFGKSYLCISELNNIIGFNDDSKEWIRSFVEDDEKLIVVIDDNETTITSLKHFQSKKNLCKNSHVSFSFVPDDPFPSISYDVYKSKIEIWDRKEFKGKFTCHVLIDLITYIDFSINIKTLKYQSYRGGGYLREKMKKRDRYKFIRNNYNPMMISMGKCG